jgi:ribosome-associated protein
MSEQFLIVSESVRVPLAELRFQFSRSSGPGGQNVNKLNTRIQMWWNVAGSDVLAGDARRRFLDQNATKLTNEGELLIECQQFRTQLANRQWCLDELARLIRRSLVRPKQRRATKPTRGSKERRLKSKQQRSQKKSQRSFRANDD